MPPGRARRRRTAESEHRAALEALEASEPQTARLLQACIAGSTGISAGRLAGLLSPVYGRALDAMLRDTLSANVLHAGIKYNVIPGEAVLEIGCGQGRLTLRLAAFRPKHIEALDPDPKGIRVARKNQPARYRRLISYHVGHAEKLRYPPGTFDTVIFSWAL